MKGKKGKKEEKKGGKKESRNISEVGRRKGNKERGKPGMQGKGGIRKDSGI